MQKKGANTANSKILAFLKRNIYYVLMIVCVLAITAVITTVAVLNSNSDSIDAGGNPPIEKPDGGDGDKEPPVVKEFLLEIPVVNGIVSKEFSDTELVFDSTLDKYTVHMGVDLKGELGANVIAGFEGKVTAVTNDTYYGGCVTIDHGNGFVSVYKLVGDVKVKVGDTVSSNTVIGTISNEFLYECADEPHIHYELQKDKDNVNPTTYFINDEK